MRSVNEATLRFCVETRGIFSEQDTWKMLTGGRTNALWRIMRPRGNIVLKLFSEGTKNPLFPNDAAQEVGLLHYLSTHGIAPQLIDRFATKHGTCIVYGHIEGHTWITDVEKAAHLLRQLHQIAPPPGLRTVPYGSAALRLHAHTILNACAEPDQVKLLEMEPTHTVAPSGFKRLLHGDPVPTNIILHDRKSHLIDWQCPAMGDPCEDIAVFLSPAMQLRYRGEVLSMNDIERFLDAYADQEILRGTGPWHRGITGA